MLGLRAMVAMMVSVAQEVRRRPDHLCYLVPLGAVGLLMAVLALGVLRHP